MPAPKAPPIQLTAEQAEVLNDLARAHSTGQQLAERARIILFAAAGKGICESAAELGIWRKTVRQWRRRWGKAEASSSVIERLRDEPRSGAPAVFTPEQICQM